MLNFLRKKENKSDKELENFQMIPVPDIRAYMIKGYEEIREIKKEKEELAQKVKDLTAEITKNKQLYEAQLIVAQEFENRYNKLNKDLEFEKVKRQDENEKRQADIDLNLKRIDELKEEKYILEEKLKNIERYQEQILIKATREYKDKLIATIKNMKGRMSKDIVIGIIEQI